MSKSTSVLFRKSLIAAAVLSLSACSSTPRIGDYDLGRVGEGIANAGRTTADVTSRAWNKTTYLLGFSDNDGETVSDEGLLMDAEDVALLDDQAPVARDTVVRPIVIRSAIPSSQQQTPMNTVPDEQAQTPTSDTAEPDATDVTAAQLEQMPDATDMAAAQLEQTPDASDMAAAELEQTPTYAPTQDALADESAIKEDVVHEVAVSETLWDIAKKTTGDANNWHILADVNNLGPGASVFPGQELIIPADMAKQDYDTQVDADEPQLATADVYVNTQNLTGSSDVSADTALSDTTDVIPEQQISGKPFTVNPGETLWDFSKRITGDATNWQAIAGENNFSDKQASYVRTGQTIFVPENLVKPETDAAQTDEEFKPDSAQLTQPAPDPQAALPDTQVAEQQLADESEDELAITVITSASAAARQSKDSATMNASSDSLNDATSTLDETQPIKIVEATFKSSKSPTAIAPAPLNDDTEALVASENNGKSPAQIMVSGTYYPKAVYNEADFSSSLLMRVSPGTTLQVSKAMGSWYQVKTEKGLGYVHQRDIR